jgi:hypothetical protein
MIEDRFALAREVLPTALAGHREGSARARSRRSAAAAGIEPGPELGRIGRSGPAIFASDVRRRKDAIGLARKLRAGGDDHAGAPAAIKQP